MDFFNTVFSLSKTSFLEAYKRHSTRQAPNATLVTTAVRHVCPRRGNAAGVTTGGVGRMRYLVPSLAVLLVCGSACADELSDRAWQLESKGDAAGARALLRQAAQSAAATTGTLRDYAEFLDRHHDPATRAAYQHVLAGTSSVET